MNKLIKKAEHFFTTNTVWIYLTLFLFLSYLLIMSELTSSFENYILTFLKTCICFMPVLLFAAFRAWLKNKFSFPVLALIWLCCFILWPLIIFKCKDELIGHFVPADPVINPPEAMSIFASGFFMAKIGAIWATELAILISTYLLEKYNNGKWLEKFNLDYLLFFTICLLSVFLGIKGVIQLGAVGETGAATSRFYLGYKFFVFTLQYLLIIGVYYFYYAINKNFLIPKLLKQKGLIFYGFSVAGVVLVFYPVFTFLIRLLPMVEELEIKNYFINPGPFAEDGGGMPFLVVLLSVPIIISNQWFRQNSLISDLKKEKSETELTLLKQQINPHFFFNTLNNLYAMSITKDEQTPEVILQLSELMRYVIYKGKEEQVAITEEVKYIEDYVHLQQIRLHKKLDFKFEKQIEDAGKQIPPLLFITFVENAFKHGIEPAEGDCFLHLALKTEEEGLTFTCKNSIEQNTKQDSGIGLENFRRRMSLRFPRHHKIMIQKSDDTYSAKLLISGRH